VIEIKSGPEGLRSPEQEWQPLSDAINNFDKKLLRKMAAAPLSIQDPQMALQILMQRTALDVRKSVEDDTESDADFGV